MSKPPKIFISYRRQDSQQMAERIYEALVPHFPIIFYDLNTIEYGRDFADKIQQGIYESDVVLVLIGDKWADIMLERRNLVEDHVRIEVETALELRKRVIPVLIGSTAMPPTHALPWRIAERFTRLNAQPMHITNPYFKIDIDQLVKTLQDWEQLPPPKSLPPMRTIETQDRWRQITLGVALLAVLFALLALFGFTSRETITTEVTRIVEQTVEVTRIAEGSQIIEQTVEVPVTQIVEQIVHVPVTEIVKETLEVHITQIVTVPVTEIIKETLEVPVTVIRTSPPTIVTATPAPTLSIPLPERVAIDGVASNPNWQAWIGEAGYVRTFGTVNTEMVLVPAGEFEMGSSSANANDDEQPHNQRIDNPFWISKYEVTNTQFALFLYRNGNSSPEGIEYLVGDNNDNIQFFLGRWRERLGFENRPVTHITWFGARDYCQWLGEGFRLPTEKEWEYAASGPSNWEYPWGNEWKGDNAVMAGNSGGQTAEVGSHPSGASWVGALDMGGNVAELVSSIYASYPYDNLHEFGDTENARVVRGGSFFSIVKDLGTARRDRKNPEESGVLTGFRCASDYTP